MGSLNVSYVSSDRICTRLELLFLMDELLWDKKNTVSQQKDLCFSSNDDTYTYF